MSIDEIAKAKAIAENMEDNPYFDLGYGNDRMNLDGVFSFTELEALMTLCRAGVEVEWDTGYNKRRELELSSKRIDHDES